MCCLVCQCCCDCLGNQGVVYNCGCLFKYDVVLVFGSLVSLVVCVCLRRVVVLVSGCVLQCCCVSLFMEGVWFVLWYFVQCCCGSVSSQGFGFFFVFVCLSEALYKIGVCLSMLL